ncbi:MAG: hypothetical protein ACK4PR_09270, partial [Gammaproteobacteria bacterium]
EYEICFHYHFFKDGNKRIAIALSSFYLMRYDLPLPQFRNIDQWLCAAPIKLGDFNVDSERDPYFYRWYMNYIKLFRKPLNYKMPVIEQEHLDPWKISVDEIIYLNGTIYEHISRSREEIKELSDASGLEVKELVVFLPDRMALHECIVNITVMVDLSDLTLLDKLLSTEKFYGKEILPKVQYLQNSWQKLKNNFENYVKRILESYLPGVGVDKKIKDRIEYYREKIESRIIQKQYDGRVLEINKVLKKLVADELLREHLLSEISKVVKNTLTEYIILNHINQMVIQPNFSRMTWVIAGGPAAGKSSLTSEVNRILKRAEPTGSIPYCKVNPDLFKKYLIADNKSTTAFFAAMTHVESSYIVHLLINRLHEMVNANQAPHILLDTVKSSEDKMQLAREGGASVNLFIASCAVEGETGAIKRAFKRAKDNKSPDYGRYVPTYEILNGHKQESLLLPETIKRTALKLRIYTTKDKHPSLIAVIDDYSKNLRVYDPPEFYAFIRKSEINVNAQSEDKLYSEKLTAERLVKLLLAYTTNEITLLFKYNVLFQNPFIEEFKNEKNANQKENKRLLKLDKKEDNYAVINNVQGFVCQNIMVFSKTLKAFDISLDEFIIECLDYEDQFHPKGIPVVLYDASTQMKLFEYDGLRNVKNFDKNKLSKLLPNLFAHIQSPCDPMQLGILELFKRFGANTNHTEYAAAKAMFAPYLSNKKRILRLTTILKQYPVCVQAYRYRGSLYRSEKKLDKALNDFEQAVFYEPHDAQLYIECGQVLLMKKEYIQAIENYNTAIELAPNDINAYYARSRAFFYLRKNKEALNDLNKMVTLAPKNSNVYLLRARDFHVFGLY